MTSAWCSWKWVVFPGPNPKLWAGKPMVFFFPCGKLFTRILMEIGEKEDSLVKNFPGLFLEGEVAKEDRAAVEPPASPASPGRALPRPLAGGSQGPGQGLRTLAPLATPAGWFSGAAGYPVHRRMLSSVHLLGAGSFALPSCDNQKCSRLCQMSPGVHHRPWLRTTCLSGGRKGNR